MSNNNADSERRSKHLAWKKQFIHRRKATGICTECNTPSVKGRTRCAVHLASRVEQRRLRSQAAVEKGFCADCITKPSLANHRCCLDCYLRQASKGCFGTRKRWRELSKLFEKQMGICPYTGFVLTLGKDTDLDHIIPLSRGGGTDIDNLQWVMTAVNDMKNSLLEAEFFHLISAVFSHRHLDTHR